MTVSFHSFKTTTACSIEVAISRYTTGDIPLMLVSAEDYQQYQNDMDGPELTVAIRCTAMTTLSGGDTTWDIKVPAPGVWHIAFQPHLCSSIAVRMAK